MKKVITETKDVREVHLLFDPDGGKRVVVRYVEFYGDVIEQESFNSLEEAIKSITEQGE